MRTIRDEDDCGGVAFDDVEVLRCTAKAAQYNIAGESVWIPHSQVHDDSELYYDERGAVMSDDSGRLVITRWIAEQKGLA